MNYNINKVFRRLPIRMKLMIAFALMAFLPLTIVGAYGLFSSKAALRDSAIKQAEHRVDLLKADINNLLTRVWLDTRYLDELGRSHDLMENPGRIHAGLNHTQLEEEIALFCRNHPLYFQIRFIDSKNVEQLRIVRTDHGYEALSPRGTATPSRLYRHVTKGIAPGSFVSMPVELKHPLYPDSLIPAISLIRPCDGYTDEGVCLWIVDLYADILVEQLRRSYASNGGELVLCDAEGRYLYHPSRKMSWQQLLAKRDAETVFAEFEDSEARSIISGDDGTLSGSDRDIVSYTSVWSDPARHNRGYVLYYRIPAEVAFEPIRRFTFVFLALVALTLVLVAVASFIGSSQLTSPLRALSRSAHVIARGEFHNSIQVSSNDEIETLADDFNRMAVAIRDRERLIKNQETALRKHAKELERKVEERTSELQESHRMLARSETLAAVGRLAAGVAHEVNNPIGIILNRIESILADQQPVDTERINADLAVIAKHARRVSKVTENLLRFSRPRSIATALMDLIEACSSVISLIRPEYERRHVELAFEHPANPVLVMGDPDQLEQVLLNLLDNALHVSAAGQRVSVGLEQNTQRVSIRVSDQGPGIPPSDMDRIFDPFFTTKDVGQGSGLGLAICETIIREHHGTIRVSNNDDGGAVFIVDIPFPKSGLSTHG